jgi:membrane-bound serine protease (ClpP class)
MTALGFALLLVGAVLIVAEAHAPGGVLGVLGGLGLVVGGIFVIGTLGGGVWLAVPVAVGIAAAAGAWTVLIARKATGARRTRIQAGAEALCGHLGVVQNWQEPAGRVFVDGALWRAEHDWAGREDCALHEGDRVVVMRVNGLTLSVRRAEDWELVA